MPPGDVGAGSPHPAAREVKDWEPGKAKTRFSVRLAAVGSHSHRTELSHQQRHHSEDSFNVRRVLGGNRTYQEEEGQLIPFCKVCSKLRPERMGWEKDIDSNTFQVLSIEPFLLL